MKRNLLIATFFLAAAGFASAQIAAPSTDVLGAHLNYGRGCAACHAPHSGAYGNGVAKTADPNAGGLALWGDRGNEPTSVLLQLGSNSPVYSAVTPGSMMGVDVVIDTAGGTPTTTVVYLATGGKATPANAFGNGGSFQVWRITVPK